MPRDEDLTAGRAPGRKLLLISLAGGGGLLAVLLVGVLLAAVILRPRDHPPPAPAPAPAPDRASAPPPSPQTHPPLKDEPALAVEPGPLFLAYRQNLAAAEGRYRGKVLELSGVYVEVKRDRQGYYLGAVPFGRLVEEEDWRPPPRTAAEAGHRGRQGTAGAAYLPGIILRIDPDDLPLFAPLTGQKATVRGRCAGAVPGEGTLPAFHVLVEHVRPGA